MAEIKLNPLTQNLTSFIASRPYVQPKPVKSFGQILEQKIQENQVREQPVFSKHAMQRLDTRNIQISPQLMIKLTEAINKARIKGIKDTLILSDEAAFIVNVPNNVVVTTFNDKEMKDTIFTNIDGTVVI